MHTRPLIVAAALSVIASGVFAQTRVDRSGATDANNRVGSNGRNSVSTRQTPWEISNQVVYGNVTGGKAFRGPTASTDPQAFRGATGSANFDRFVRGSSGVTTGGVPTYNANETRPYYGDARGVNPPAGTVGVSSVGGYSPPQPTSVRNIDVRLGSVSDGTTTINPANSDTTVSGGAVDTVYAPGARVAAPATLSGVSEYTNLNTTNTADFTPGQIKQNQSEEPQSKLPGQTPANGTTNNFNADAQAQQAPTAGNPVNNAPAAGGPQVGTSTLVNAPQPDATANTATPDAGTVTRFTPRADQPVDRTAAGQAQAAKTAAENNAVADQPGGTNTVAARQYNAELRKRQNPDANKPDANKPDAKGTDTNKPDTKATDAAKPDAPKAAEVSEADMARGVGDLLTKAEGQMKDGKFASAIDIYSAAEAVAPRSGTVKLGRANAELGGAFYVRAANSLRNAFAADKNLLAGKVDLRGFLGDDKLANVQRDLSDLVQNKPTDTGAAVLLAYVYHHTGNEGRASALLDVADKRAGGKDPLVQSMKAAWKPADETK